MSARSKWQAWALVALLTSAMGCGPAELRQQSSHVPFQDAYFIPYCAPTGVNLQCSLWHSRLGDLTSQASWVVSDPTVASVSPTAFVAVRGRGEVDITAAFEGQSHAFLPFLVDPQQPPRELYYLTGDVREGSEAGPVIQGATVRILDGYNAGRSSPPSSATGSYKIDRVLTRETFTVQASKSGYEPSVKTYRVDGSSGLGNGPFLRFELARLP